LLKIGGVYHTADNYRHDMGVLLGAPEYSFLDFAWWPMGSDASLRTVWPELMREYFERLDAPGGKRMTWFDESAHDIFFDQPQLLVEELIRIKGE